MAKIQQEIRKIKTAIIMTQGSSRTQVQPWANVTSKPEIATTVRIQNEEGKKKIAKLSSEELVDKIGMKKVIAARQMVNG